MKDIPLPPAILFSSIVLGLILNFVFPVARVINFPYNLVGIPSIILGLGLIAFGCKELKTHSTPIDPRAIPKKLVTTGLYNFSRNPIYLGDFLTVFGGAIFLGNLTPFVAPILFFVLINLLILPFEEQRLRQAFGGSYLKYKKSVRRWF